jgi:predicted transcriptional regulator
MPTVRVTIEMDAARRDAVAALAEARSRETSDIINEAIEAWLVVQDWQLDHIRQGVAAANAGDFATEDDVSAVLDRWIARRG